MSNVIDIPLEKFTLICDTAKSEITVQKLEIIDRVVLYLNNSEYLLKKDMFEITQEFENT
jgi:hypothetical protein